MPHDCASTDDNVVDTCEAVARFFLSSSNACQSWRGIARLRADGCYHRSVPVPLGSNKRMCGMRLYAATCAAEPTCMMCSFAFSSNAGGPMTSTGLLREDGR